MAGQPTLAVHISLTLRPKSVYSNLAEELGEFYSPRKVDNSFLGRASAYRHCPLWSSLSLRLWFTRLSHSVRPFPTANRAKSFPALFRSGFRSALCLRACLAQLAEDYAHTRTVPAAPDPPG